MAWITQGGGVFRYAYRVLWGNLKEWGHLDDLGVDGNSRNWTLTI
jgi:hypothetical protein